MKKLNAVVDPGLLPGFFIVTVTEVETGEQHILTVEAVDENTAAFKAMEIINGR